MSLSQFRISICFVFFQTKVVKKSTLVAVRLRQITETGSPVWSVFRAAFMQLRQVNVAALKLQIAHKTTGLIQLIWRSPSHLDWLSLPEKPESKSSALNTLRARCVSSGGGASGPLPGEPHEGDDREQTFSCSRLQLRVFACSPFCVQRGNSNRRSELYLIQLQIRESELLSRLVEPIKSNEFMLVMNHRKLFPPPVRARCPNLLQFVSVWTLFR